MSNLSQGQIKYLKERSFVNARLLLQHEQSMVVEIILITLGTGVVAPTINRECDTMQTRLNNMRNFIKIRLKWDDEYVRENRPNIYDN